MVTTTDREQRRSRSDAGFEDRGDRGSSGEILGELAERVEKLREEVLAYLAIRVERLRLSFFHSLFAVAGGAVAALAAATVLGTAIVFSFAGAAGGIAEATGRPWLGSLTAGVGGLFLLALGWVFARRAIARRFVTHGKKP